MKKTPDIIEDADLFRKAMASVRPLKADNKVPMPKKPLTPVKRTEVFDEISIPTPRLAEPVDSQQTLSFKRTGIQNKVLKELRLGHFKVEATIDLHGFTQSQAEKQLFTFIQRTQQQGKKVVLVIHGKGLSSQANQPVIKNLVNQLLPAIPEVLAYCSATLRDGGAGAVYVLLKATKSFANDHLST